MTSRTTSGWQLSKFLKKTVENSASYGFAAVYLENRLSQNRQILQARPCRPALHLHWIHDVTNYFRSAAPAKKQSKNANAQMASGGISRERFT